MLSFVLRGHSIDQFDYAYSEQNAEGWNPDDFDASIKALVEAEVRKVQQRVPRFENLRISPESGAVYYSNGALLEPASEGAGREIPMDGRSVGSESGASGADNFADFGERLVSWSDAARRSDRGSQGDVLRGTGEGQSVRNGASVQGRPVTDSQLESYLSSIGGGFRTHGVGVATLKRALLTREAVEGDTSDFGATPGLGAALVGICYAKGVPPRWRWDSSLSAQFSAPTELTASRCSDIGATQTITLAASV